MAISVRYYVIEDEGPLRLIPQRVNEGLNFGEDAIPEFAGSRRKVVEAVLDNEKGKPVRILDARGSYWYFDDEGKLDQSDRFSFMQWMDGPHGKPKGKVVDLRPGIERKKWNDRHRWEVTADDLDRLTYTIWPFASDKEEPTVGTVKGKAPKIPPLTHAGEMAMSKISSRVSTISMELEQLSEAALKGVAYALRRNARLYAGERLIYDALAAEADHQREIRARHRTGKGAWYADLQVMQWNEDRSQAREIDNVAERHNSKKEALAAARRLLAENAHRFDDRISLEAQVLSELEWVPMKSPREEEED